jgi:hypothetical protein
MTIAGWALFVIGLLLYLLAFAQGPGPTMGDKPLQATLYTLATVAMIGGLVLLLVI